MVLLVLEPTERSRPRYIPLMSALKLMGAERVLKTAWLIDVGVEDVRATLRVHLPHTDGFVIAEVGAMQKREARRAKK